MNNIKKIIIILIILLVILIPVAGFFGTQAILSIGSVADVPLPNFVDMTREEAERTAEEAGLQLNITEEYNSDVEEGRVISQDPAYLDGYTVKENSTVTIVISMGENIKIVPRVIGETQENAQELITAEELEVEVVEEASSTVEAGIVIRQDPEAETELNAGETVTIYVSTGTKQITMVNVVGQSESDAKNRLTELGFEVDVVYEEDTSKDDGVVLRQSISSGETVNDGTQVTLTVNQIAERSSINVIIDVRAATGGYTEPEEGEDGGSSTVNINVNGETRSGVSKNETAYSSITLSGRQGEELDINVTITDPSTGDTIYSSTKTVRLGSQNSITFN